MASLAVVSPIHNAKRPYRFSRMQQQTALFLCIPHQKADGFSSRQGYALYPIHKRAKRFVVLHIGLTKNDMIMDMVFVRMRGKNILMLTLKEFVA